MKWLLRMCIVGGVLLFALLLYLVTAGLQNEVSVPGDGPTNAANSEPAQKATAERRSPEAATFLHEDADAPLVRQLRADYRKWVLEKDPRSNRTAAEYEAAIVDALVEEVGPERARALLEKWRSTHGDPQSTDQSN